MAARDVAEVPYSIVPHELRGIRVEGIIVRVAGLLAEGVVLRVVKDFDDSLNAIGTPPGIEDRGDPLAGWSLTAGAALPRQ